MSIDPPSPLAVRDDALLAAVQEGLRAAAGRNDELKAVIDDLKVKLQQLIDVNQELREAMKSLRSNTYTVTCTITPQAT